MEKRISNGVVGAIKGAIAKAVVGLVLFLASFPLLFWNEGRAVQRHQSLLEGLGSVESVSAVAPPPGSDGKLIHVSGLATTSEELYDPLFDVRTRSLRLERSTEMFQWKENIEMRKRGEERIPVPTYEKKWSGSVYDSSEYQDAVNHRNPERKPIDDESWAAQVVSIGSLELSEPFKKKLKGSEPLDVSEVSIPVAFEGRMRRVERGFYLGANAEAPEIGDLRIQFQHSPPRKISVIGQIAHGTLVPYQTKAGGRLALVSPGIQPADTMFHSSISQNKTVTWVLRVLGFVAMMIGLMMIAGPILSVAQWVPFAGGLMTLFVGVVAFLIALVGTSLTVGVAWVFYRPVLGISLLALAVVATVIVVTMMKRTKNKARSASVPPIPPPPPPG